MTRLKNLCLGTAFALSLGLPVSAQDAADANTVVATVNGVEITVGHMLMARAQLPDQYQQLAAETLFEGLREQLIQQTLLVQSLGEMPQRLKFALENERRSLIAGEALNKAVNAAISEDAIKAAYDARFADTAPAKEFNASHILVETEEEAAALITMLEGGSDFADLARENSTGPSGPNGGQLGWFGAGQMVAPFETAVAALQDGAISGPVQTQFGWHVIMLNESRDQAIPPLEQVRQELVSELERAAAEAEISALMGGATVTRADAEAVDPAVIGNPDLIAD